MRTYLIVLITSLLGGAAIAQNQINFHTTSGTQTYTLYEDDSIYFDGAHTTLYFANNSSVLQFSVSDVTTIDFTTDNSNTIYINYQGSTAVVTNPLAGNGVEVTVNGAFVTVTSTTLDKDVNYVLSGTTANGGLKVYSDFRYNVLLDNVSLTNPTGPAINSQSEKRVRVHLLSGTNNTITDGVTYSANATEDQKGTFFAEGKIDIIGSGSLTVNGVGADQHAIATDEDLEILEGAVTIVSAVKDGVHTSEGFFMNGGNITVNAADDGIDGGEGNIQLNCGDITIHSVTADTKAMVCDSTFEMNGGNLTITVAGNTSKGIKGGSDMYFNGGTVTASTTGGIALVASGSGNDPSYSKLIASDSTIYFNGTNLTLTNSGIGSRAISADEHIEITDGAITATGSGNGTTYTNSTGVLDAYHGVQIRANGNLVMNGGTVTLSHSGKGGKGIDADGTITIGNGTSTPDLNITTTGAVTTITAGTGGGPQGNPGTSDKPRAVKGEGAVTINSGAIAISSTNDGIKSTTSFTMNGGDLTIANSTEGIESPFITVNGGEVSITASDDGFNATHGTVAGGTESNDGSLLKITNGYCYVSATGGDAVDSNGGLQITGGTLVVHGPTSSPELGMDYNGTATISGGKAVVSGPGQQMLQGFGAASTQKSFILKTSTTIAANTLFHVMDANGVELFTFKPIRGYQTIVFSSPLIANGTYKIYTSGSHTGTNTDGLYAGGAYTIGTLRSTFTVSGTVTTVTF